MTRTVLVDVYPNDETGDDAGAFKGLEAFASVRDHRADLPRRFDDALQDWVLATDAFDELEEAREGVGVLEYEPDGEVVDVRLAEDGERETPRAVDRLSSTSLTERQAEAYILREVEGCSREETAERMGISTSAVDQHLSAARGKVGDAHRLLSVLEGVRSEDRHVCKECGDEIEGEYVAPFDGGRLCAGCHRDTLPDRG
jgi:DNA-binding CsgD family transcriptional regulator